jgi:hypothetical protein
VVKIYRDKAHPSSVSLSVPGGGIEVGEPGPTMLILIMVFVLLLAAVIIGFTMFMRSKMKRIGTS